MDQRSIGQVAEPSTGKFGNVLDSFNDDVYISADIVGTVEANNISAA